VDREEEQQNPQGSLYGEYYAKKSDQADTDQPVILWRVKGDPWDIQGAASRDVRGDGDGDCRQTQNCLKNPAIYA
jgi:hypothetical protein